MKTENNYQIKGIKISNILENIRTYNEIARTYDGKVSLYVYSDEYSNTIEVVRGETDQLSKYNLVISTVEKRNLSNDLDSIIDRIKYIESLNPINK